MMNNSNSKWRLRAAKDGFVRRLPRMATHDTVYVALILAAFLFGAVAVYAHNHHFLTSASPRAARLKSAAPHHVAAARSPSQPRGSGPSQQSGTSLGASTRTAPAAAQVPPANPACSLLTAAVASQVLGPDAKPVAAGNTDKKTTDMEVSTCLYAGSAVASSPVDQIRLEAHTALSALGKSENDVKFGSDKPSGVTDVTGYGQAAYWTQSTGELNILSHNNWFVLSRAPGSSSHLQDVEAVAQRIAPELR
jgi:hypothetical protein